MNLQKNGMNGQERKEWEALCRQYNVDSLYEAIQGCREELEFLIPVSYTHLTLPTT